MEEKAMSIKSIARKCAEYFKGIMAEEGFDTFEEMKQCYWWDSSDIKEEIKAIILDYEWFFNDDETEIFYIGDESTDTSYRKFIKMVYSYIK